MRHAFRTFQDRLVLIVNRFSIRSTLLAGFAMVIVPGIFMVAFTEWTGDAAIEALERFIRKDNEVADLCMKSIAAMSNARRNEKDFILNYREFGFDEAKSRYITRLLTTLADVDESMKRIRLLTDDPVVASQLTEVDQAVGRYRDRVLVMVEKYGRVGFYKSGLNRTFRETAHEMEGLLKRHGSHLLLADLLELRRREKDFILRNRDSDAAELRKAAGRFSADMGRSGLPAGVKGELASLLATYGAIFEEYVRTIEEIRTIKSDYIKTNKVIEPTLERLYLHFTHKAEEALAEIKKKDFMFDLIKGGLSAFILLGALAVALAISMAVSNSLDESRSFAEQVAAGNLGSRLAPRGENEFATLVLALNGMANSLENAELARQKWAADLRDSEENVRRLNRELEQKVEERTRQLLETQDKLVQKEKEAMLGLIAGNMGNELRNPLGVMSNAVYFLKEVLPDADGTVREYLEIIGREIDSSQRIISALIDFTLVKHPVVRTVSPHELVRQGIGRCAVPDNVSVELDLPDALPALLVDPSQMEQVLQHLVTNAVQAMPDGGALRVSARQVPGARSEEEKQVRGRKAGTRNEERGEPRTSNLEPVFVEIFVTDTGSGIAPEHMTKIFQPLFTTRSRGIGLGLPLTKNLTEANGGLIAVESEPGKGTTFTVVLPAEV